MKIISYFPGIGQLRVISKKDVIYTYKGVSPFIHQWLRTKIKHKSYGRAWQRLRRMERG